eukprot:CAMPEP_0172557682 /NCGR_PEP_ID=MMETSP1067-20121228/74604_1 /TAXON_ID=265564 ORGANISM="Thalassiosira punctigera, Strain Tpunct2005C2" /NCGR_SAMPLE_ID=MMETSP1067 /ASSEMBLY_ACC=CAM_ASM_000444 /LENGTH=59 /DNA_ID=CAMNT_0013346831 /DNA_START=87 /DNA_END=262 /DNA_ORIENTATION=-
MQKNPRILVPKSEVSELNDSHRTTHHLPTCSSATRDTSEPVDDRDEELGDSIYKSMIRV